MKLFEVIGFEDKKTGMPTYDDMMADPDYFARAKRRKHGIVMMSPDEYINKAVEGFKKSDPDATTESVIRTRDPDLVNEYAKQMQAGAKFPTIMLDYSIGFSQEGLHRALAAKQIGLDEIPVMVVSMTRRSERGTKRASY